jgi:microcystin degradation protein MlrC
MRLLERKSAVRAGMFIVDPKAVQKAFETGVGNEAEFAIGAGFTVGMPGPLVAVGRVCSLHDGSFVAEGPANKGVPGSMGLCAVIRIGNMDILVTEKCSHSGDPQLFRHFGIEPTMYDLIEVKANTSFKKPYSAFAGQICYADVPGAGAANLKQLQWTHLPKGTYPFDLPENYQPEKAKIY